MKKVILLLAFAGFMFTASAQDNVGIGTTSPDASAKLDVVSTAKGFLLPRMTSAQRDAIANPASSLLIFNLTDACLQINLGTPAAPDWQCLCTNCAACTAGTVVWSWVQECMGGLTEGPLCLGTPDCNVISPTPFGGNLVSIASGEAILLSPNLPAGNYTITMTYSSGRVTDTDWGVDEVRINIDNCLDGTASNNVLTLPGTGLEPVHYGVLAIGGTGDGYNLSGGAPIPANTLAELESSFITNNTSYSGAIGDISVGCTSFNPPTGISYLIIKSIVITQP